MDERLLGVWGKVRLAGDSLLIWTASVLLLPFLLAASFRLQRPKAAYTSDEPRATSHEPRASDSVVRAAYRK